MAPPDSRPAEFDYPVFDSRDFAPAPGLPVPPSFPSRDLPFWAPRDHRDSRDPHPPAHAPATYYHTPATSMPSAQLNSLVASADGARQANMVAPRMLSMGSAAQNMGLGTGERDAWSAAPGQGTPAAGPGAQSTVGLTAGNGRPPAVHQNTPAQAQVQPQHSLVFNRHHRASPPRPPHSFQPSPAFTDRDAYIARQLHQQTSSPPSAHVATAQPSSAPSPNTATPQRSTLWWGELEPWMDEEYAKQVCNLMGWDPVNIKVPRPNPDPMTGRQANNPGYCFLTFPSNVHAASVLSQVNNNNPANTLTMPNSSKPFTMNWASSVPTAPLPVPFAGPTISIPGAQNPQYPKEYSIFVGDLAPEVSNSDLVAVFRNPVLGLRNDREPRFIRPFLSCKSAKIMLDPVTGVSRGYGFVRFTDEADQQRALIEMHGLYCLSRPMRISPATAKFKPIPGMPGMDFSQMPFPQMMPHMSQMPDQQHQQQQQQMALPVQNGAKSVSAPLASASGSNNSLNSTGGSASSLSAPSLSSTSSATSSSTLASPPSDDMLKSVSMSASVSNNSTSMGSNSTVPTSISAGLAQQTQDQMMAQRYNIPEESWKHHAQARAILSNLIGPNGEQLTSSDPYNTTVFVGGLSPLIAEDTLRTFFAPFGEIHYVKVPVGKHCGFVQFVRKPDAERAIEKMQGFPIGGSRIRLSWGRSQYKAAQAAAQAAQAAAFQAQYQVQMASPTAPSLTAEQAMQLLEKFGITQFLNPNGNGVGAGNNSTGNNMSNINAGASNNAQSSSNVSVETLQAAPTSAEQAAIDMMVQQFDAFAPSSFEQRPGSQFNASAFSPFSPDPNYLPDSVKNRDSMSVSSGQSQPYTAKGYAPWYSSNQQDEKVPTSATSANGKVSPTSAQASRPASARAFGNFLGDQNSPFPPPNRTSSRQEGLIARPDLPRRSSHALPLPSQDQFPGQDGRDHDHMRDVNAALASLSLGGHDQVPWANSNTASP